MSAMRRTTITAPEDSLATLRAEARRRGVSLTVVVAEAIEEKAAALRAAHRPRFGLGASSGRSRGAAVLTGEPVANDPR